MQMKEAGDTNKGYEISQNLPFPTKIYKDSQMRDLEAEAQTENSKYQSTVILTEARLAYIMFWSSFERLQILKEKQTWLKNHLKIARSATRSDSGAQIHLLGIESSYDVLENEILTADADLTEKRNALKIFAPSLDVSEIVPSNPTIFEVSASSANASSLLKWKKKEVEAKEALESYKKHSYLPDLFFRYRDYAGSDMQAANQEMMVGITMPFLFFWQPKAEVAEARANKMKAEVEYRKLAIEADSKLSTFAQKANSSLKQLKNLNEKLLPRAHRRMKLVENLSQRSMEGLEEHRTVMLDYLDLRMKAVELRVDYENSLKEIVRLSEGDKRGQQ